MAIIFNGSAVGGGEVFVPSKDFKTKEEYQKWLNSPAGIKRQKEVFRIALKIKMNKMLYPRSPWILVWWRKILRNVFKKRMRYHYILRLVNSKKSTLADDKSDIDACNVKVFSAISSIEYVETKTRFCLPRAGDGLICLMAIWSYEPVHIEVISKIVKDAGAKLVSYAEE